MNNYSFQEKVPQKVRKNLVAYPELIQDLLFYRGVDTAEAAEEFLNPDYEEHTHDPFLIKDMKKAVERILLAIKNKEKIIIYSDYDCDGIPGGVILHDFFKKIEYKNFENYIPHRHNEGYGLNVGAIEKCAEGGATLIITVDSGITDVEQVTRANELGVDVIITDHHLIGEQLPDAYAILNSKQDDDDYPFDLLCGAAVAFKLVQALLKKGDFKIKEGWEKWLLDMAGLSTIADMVPLHGENRVLAYYGLKVLRKSSRPGLQHLCKTMRVAQRNITEDDIGFMIAPRINAASRMDFPMDAFCLLTTNDLVDAGELSSHLHKVNNKRKGVVASTVKEAKKRLTATETVPEVIVLGNSSWKPSLVGLVANTLVETYERPVFLWGKDGKGTIKGSCRAPSNVNLVTLMSKASNLFIEYGGHSFSGGFSVSDDNIHHLGEALCAAYIKLPKEEVAKQVTIDKVLSIDDVNWKTHELINRLAPFGQGNPKPQFLFKGVEINEVKHFGKEKNHLRLEFLDSTRRGVSAIGFFKTADDFAVLIAPKENINLVASIEKSTFLGKIELRLRIVDIS